MKEAARKEIRDAANMVKEAYNWIVEHPVPFKTTIVFDIQSDCELTPNIRRVALYSG